MVSIPSRPGSRPGLARALTQLDRAVRGEARPALGAAARPAHEEALEIRGGAQAEVYPHVARAQVAPVRVGPPPEGGRTPTHESHLRSLTLGVVLHPEEPHLQPVAARADLVEQQPSGAVVVGDQDV